MDIWAYPRDGPLSDFKDVWLNIKEENKRIIDEMMEECLEEVGKMERDKELFERQIKIVDAQIDKLVYELYGLTEEEVKVVEGELASGRKRL